MSKTRIRMGFWREDRAFRNVSLKQLSAPEYEIRDCERDGIYGGSAFIYSPIGGMFVEGRRLSERNAYPAIEIEDI